MPFLIATKPLSFRAARAFFTACIQGPTLLAKRFLASALCFLLTTLPRLLIIRSAFERPPTVFSLFPRSTTALAYLPWATLLTVFFFMAFMAFMAFIAFIAFAILIVRNKQPKERLRDKA